MWRLMTAGWITRGRGIKRAVTAARHSASEIDSSLYSEH